MTCDLNIAAVWETRESYWLTIAHSVREYEIGSRNSAVRSFLYHGSKISWQRNVPAVFDRKRGMYCSMREARIYEGGACGGETGTWSLTERVLKIPSKTGRTPPIQLLYMCTDISGIRIEWIYTADYCSYCTADYLYVLHVIRVKL